MDPDWRLIAAAAMTRALRTDPDFSDGQRIGAVEAMASHTSAGAWQSHADGWRGAIAQGLAADLILLDRAADGGDPWSLTDLSVVATFVDGAVVHGATA